MVILGLNILHDATATLLVEGKIAASVAEERMSRIKYHCGFPFKSIVEVLRIAGVSPQHVDKVVLSFNSNFDKMPHYYTDYQVVKKSANPSYYKILKEYEKRTGLPLFINTSFNMHEEPIVTTPEDAIRSLERGCVDVLSIGLSWVWKDDNNITES